MTPTQARVPSYASWLGILMEFATPLRYSEDAT